MVLSFDSNDLNVFANSSDYNNFDVNNVFDSNFVFDENIFGVNFDLNVFDSNFSDSNYLSDVNDIPDSNVGFFSLNFFSNFLSDVASLFSKFSNFFGLNNLFDGFVEAVFPQDKNFELKEKEVEINGQKAKCFGVACDSLPNEVN
ncbi:MAG: hypothetical protein QXD98_03430 [Candidatus Diapherotrites archaeon]